MPGVAVPAAQRRRMILDSAVDLFVSRGFHGAGMDDIAAAAGVTGPAIYRHFLNKDALLVALFDALCERLARGVEEVAATASSPAGALEAVVRFQVSLSLDERAICILWISEERNLPPDDRHRVRRAMRAYIDRWVDLLRPLRPDLSDGELLTAVHATIGLANSTATQHQLPMPRPDLERTLTRMALAALLTPASPG